MRKLELLLAVTAAALVAAPAAHAATVANGDFETGDLSGWTVNSTTSSANGYWFAYSGTVAPLTGAPLGTTVAAPPQGTYGALADEINPGRRILYQDVSLEPLPNGGSHELRLWVYYKAQQGALATPPDGNLDPVAPGTNEQFRIDVMDPDAPLTSVAPADVLLHVFGTQTGDPTTLAPTEMSADLTPFAGRTVRLRFAEVDNAGVLNASTDDVRIDSQITPPTPPDTDPQVQIGTPTRDRTNGTATLPVDVSAAGTIEISGESLATETLQVGEAGTYALPVRPVNPLKAKVKKARSGSANIVVKFTDANAKSATGTRRVHLRDKRR